MAGQYFKTPGVWETIQGIWPWFWELFKFFIVKLWPLWVLMLGAWAIKFFIIKLEKKIDRTKVEKTKKMCPSCKEWIPKDATRCSHCTQTI